MDGVNFDLEVPLQVIPCRLQLCRRAAALNATVSIMHVAAEATVMPAAIFPS